MSPAASEEERVVKKITEMGDNRRKRQRGDTTMAEIEGKILTARELLNAVYFGMDGLRDSFLASHKDDPDNEDVQHVEGLTAVIRAVQDQLKEANNLIEEEHKKAA